MAKKVVIQLVDDIDGTAIDEGEGQTVTFALDGQTYEIDLTNEKVDEMRAALSAYIAAARRAGRAPARAAKKSATGGTPAAEIRDWARSNGLDVPDRGRIPQDVRDAFDKR